MNPRLSQQVAVFPFQLDFVRMKIKNKNTPITPILQGAIYTSHCAFYHRENDSRKSLFCISSGAKNQDMVMFRQQTVVLRKKVLRIWTQRRSSSLSCGASPSLWRPRRRAYWAPTRPAMSTVMVSHSLEKNVPMSYVVEKPQCFIMGNTSKVKYMDKTCIVSQLDKNS